MFPFKNAEKWGLYKKYGVKPYCTATATDTAMEPECITTDLITT